MNLKETSTKPNLLTRIWAWAPAQNRVEAQALVLAIACFFCVLTSYYIIRPIREQFASEAGGSQALPMLYLMVFTTMILVTPFYGAIVAKFSRRIFVPVIYLFFLSCMLVIGPLFRLIDDSVINARIFYVWVSIFNLFIVSVFWSCMSDVFDPSRSKRMYGFIAIGGTAGAYFGPRIAGYFVASIGIEGLYKVAAAFLLFALVCLIALLNSSKARTFNKNTDESSLGGGIWEGAHITLKNPFMRRMALLLLCADGVSTILYSKVSDYAKITFTNSVDRTIFFASLDWNVALISFCLQIVAVPLFMAYFGASRTQAFPNLANFFGLIFVAITGDVALLPLALILTRSGGYGLVNPARESLFTRVGRDVRFKAKAFIDTVVWRGGDLMMVTMVATLVNLGAGVGTFGILAACFALIAVALSWNVEQLLPISNLKDKT